MSVRVSCIFFVSKMRIKTPDNNHNPPLIHMISFRHSNDTSSNETKMRSSAATTVKMAESRINIFFRNSTQFYWSVIYRSDCFITQIFHFKEKRKVFRSLKLMLNV